MKLGKQTATRASIVNNAQIIRRGTKECGENEGVSSPAVRSALSERGRRSDKEPKPGCKTKASVGWAHTNVVTTTVATTAASDKPMAGTSIAAGESIPKLRKILPYLPLPLVELSGKKPTILELSSLSKSSQLGISHSSSAETVSCFLYQHWVPVAKPQQVLTKPLPQEACWFTARWFVIEQPGSVMVALPPSGAEPEAVDSGAGAEVVVVVLEAWRASSSDRSVKSGLEASRSRSRKG